VSRRTKKEIEEESSSIYRDITDTLSFISYTNEAEIKEKVNEYRTNYTNLDRVSVSQIRTALNKMIGQGLVRKRKEKYKYV
jgi:hypothetical protein